jgi:hypothetical protein
MTKQEFSYIADALREFYPDKNILPTPHSMELWYQALQDIEYNVMAAGLNKWIMTNKWPPTIADLRDISAEIISEPIADWGEGWQRVKRAFGLFGYYNEQAAMDSFDEITRLTVKRLGWQTLCLSEDQNTDRANFRMIYQELAKRKQEDAKIPDYLKKMIAGIREQQIAQLERKDD